MGKENRNLDAQLQTDDELQGVLARGIAALPALMERGRFTEPKSVREAKSQFISRSDALRSFLDEECKLGPDEWIAKTDLYQAYRRHAQDNGSKVMSNREFYSRVEQI